MNPTELLEPALSTSHGDWATVHAKLIADWKSSVRPENLSIRPDGVASIDLDIDVRELIVELRRFGRVIACTTNPFAMLSNVCTYPRFRECRCKGRAIDPDGKLAVLMDASIRARGVMEKIAGRATLGIEFVNRSGQTIHRCCLLPDANWEQFVRRTADWQRGGARGLRLAKESPSGRWDHRDQSARVWVEENGRVEKRPARSWIEDFKVRRDNFLAPGDASVVKSSADEIYSLISRASIERRRLGITVPNPYFLSSLAMIPNEVQWRSGSVRVESHRSCFQICLTNLVEFYRVDMSEAGIGGTAYEAYDADGNIALAFHDPG